jgi:hypothetical protein
METFQDLSLPIPSRDQLQVIHQSVPQTIVNQGDDQVKYNRNCTLTLSITVFCIFRVLGMGVLDVELSLGMVLGS